VAEQQTGNIDRLTISHGATTSELWANVPVYSQTNSSSTNPYFGMLGMAIDPSNPPSAGGPVYVFYTYDSTENRIGTITKSGTVSDIVTGLPVAGS